MPKPKSEPDSNESVDDFVPRIPMVDRKYGLPARVRLRDERKDRAYATMAARAIERIQGDLEQWLDHPVGDQIPGHYNQQIVAFSAGPGSRFVIDIRLDLGLEKDESDEGD